MADEVARTMDRPSGAGSGPGVSVAAGSDLRGLAARARHDPECFAALYDLYVDRVYAYAYRRLESKADAEDVTAQTFLAALSNLDRFTWKGGGFGAWLFRIARNLCLDALRRRSRSWPPPSRTGPSVEVDRREVGAPWPVRPGEDIGPEEAIIEEERVSRLRALIRELPPAQHEVVLLKYAAGLGNREIAAATGRSATAVSSLLNRAREKLRERLAKDDA